MQTKKQLPVFVGTEMKEIIEKAIELAKAGYWDAAIDLLEQLIVDVSPK
jgi:hypothetical protein